MSVSVKDEMFYNSEDSVKLKLPSCNRNIQRSGSGSSSVQTSASIWSNFFRTSTFLTVSPLECCLSFRMAKIITVEPAVFLYMFGNFLFTILTQQYFFNSYATSIAEGVGQNGSSCVNISAVDDHRESNDTDRIVEGHATLLAVYCALPYRLLSLIFTLLLGPLSDNFGRRPVIIITMFGAVLQGICAFFIVHFNLNLYLFVLAYALAGLGGGLPSIMMASFSYVSDISTVKWRTVRIGIIESIVFLAGILSSVLGGLWFKHLQCQLQYPLILYIVCNGAGIVYTLILIPSSMSKMQRKVMNRNKTSGLQIITRGFKILFGMVETYRSSVWIIWVTLIPTTVIVIILLGLASVNIFFLKALDWGPVKIGAQVATSLSSRFLVLIIVLPILVAIRTPDAVISIIGTCFNLTMNLFMGLTHKTYQVFIVATLQGMDALFFPPIRGLLSKLVAVEDQGALFSVVSSTENLGMLIGEVAFPLILPLSLEHNLNPGTAYIVMAALGIVPLPFLCVLVGVWCRKQKKSRIDLYVDEDPNGNGSGCEKSLLGDSYQSLQDNSIIKCDN